MSGYIRAAIGFLAFLGLTGCVSGEPSDLVFGFGFALVLWICARPRKKRVRYVKGGQLHNAKTETAP